jgi:hypothetical protein
VFTGHQFVRINSFQEDCDSEVMSCSTKQVLSYSEEREFFFEHSIKKASFSFGHVPCTKKKDLRTVKKGEYR